MIAGATVGRRKHIDLVSARAQPRDELNEPRRDGIVCLTGERRHNVQDAHGGKISLPRPSPEWYLFAHASAPPDA
jgi:hypothetical protein